MTAPAAPDADVAACTLAVLAFANPDPVILAGIGTQNVQAWQLFMQAQRLLHGQRKALCRQALALDPQCARAHVEPAEEVLSTPYNKGAAMRRRAPR